MWISINIVALILAFVWVALGIALDEPSWLTRVHGIFTGIIFFALVVVLAWYGWGAAHLMKEKPTSHKQTKLIAKVSFPKILGVTFSLFVLFTTRTMYDFIMASGQFSVDIETGTTYSALFSFVCFSLWEIIPTILVLVLFGKVQSTTLGAFSKKQTFVKKNPNYTKIVNQNNSVNTEISNSGPLAKAQIFNDPRRYDSDDETTPFKSQTSTPLLYGSNNSPSPMQFYGGSVHINEHPV